MTDNRLHHAIRNGQILLSYHQPNVGSAELWRFPPGKDAGMYANGFAVVGPLKTGFATYGPQSQESAVRDYYEQIVHLRRKAMISV